MPLFGWSDKGNNKGIKAGSRKDGQGNYWMRSDGSRGTASTKKAADGTVSYHQKDYKPGSKTGRSSSQRYDSSGKLLGKPESKRVK